MTYIYDEVIEAAGPGPEHPDRSAYTYYYGYAGGKTLGIFPTKEAAEKAGAVVTEKKFDKDGYDRDVAAYRNFQTKVIETWQQRLREEYAHLSDGVYYLVYGMAYDRGHSAGYNEVENLMPEIAEFAVLVRAVVE